MAHSPLAPRERAGSTQTPLDKRVIGMRKMDGEGAHGEVVLNIAEMRNTLWGIYMALQI